MSYLLASKSFKNRLTASTARIFFIDQDFLKILGALFTLSHMHTKHCRNCVENHYSRPSLHIHKKWNLSQHTSHHLSRVRLQKTCMVKIYRLHSSSRHNIHITSSVCEQRPLLLTSRSSKELCWSRPLLCHPVIRIHIPAMCCTVQVRASVTMTQLWKEQGWRQCRYKSPWCQCF